MKSAPPLFTTSRVCVSLSPVNRAELSDSGVIANCGGSWPMPASDRVAVGSSGSSLSTVTVPPYICAAVGAKVTVTTAAERGAMVAEEVSRVNAASSTLMLLTVRTSVPVLRTAKVAVGVAPMNTPPKSMDSGSIARSGAPMTVSATGMSNSGSSGSLLRIRMVPS